MKTKKVKLDLTLFADVTAQLPVKLSKAKLRKLLKGMQFQLTNYQSVGDDINIDKCKIIISDDEDDMGWFADNYTTDGKYIYLDDSVIP